MFNKGDIVVRLKKGGIHNIYSKIGAIWKCYKSDKYIAFYSNNSGTSDLITRKATENEIKWFNLGITNINQIPEVGGTFKNNIIITKISDRIITKDNGYYTFKYWVENYKDSYKPPIKSNTERDVMFGKEFTITDLNNCKIGNLTPEDNKIIQPFLFELGYKWYDGIKIRIDKYGLIIKTDGLIFGKSVKEEFYKIKYKEIKKEVILNYINNQKQLNTNTNEVLRKTKEVARGQINGTARMVSGRQQSTTGSRPKGNIQRVKVRETQVRRFEISGKVRLR